MPLHYKTFGSRHSVKDIISSLKAIKQKLEDIISSYYHNVLVEASHISNKCLVTPKRVMSVWMLNTIWRHKKQNCQDPVIVMCHERNGTLKSYLGFYPDDNEGGTF